MSLNNIFEISATGLTAQTVRMNTISSNLANAETISDSPENTYKAKYPIFSVIKQQVDSGFFNDQMSNGYGVQVNGIYEQGSEPIRRYEPNHPLADEEGYLHLPDINIVEQMADMMAASRAYQTNVEVMQTAKDMMQKVITLGQ